MKLINLDDAVEAIKFIVELKLSSKDYATKSLQRIIELQFIVGCPSAASDDAASDLTTAGTAETNFCRRGLEARSTSK